MGIDTSAYMTSIALVDKGEQVVRDVRIPVPVAEGEIGLRQSEAVFSHLRNLSAMKSSGAGTEETGRIKAVASAVKPRPVSGSYMPVFKVSETLGVFLEQTTGLFHYPLSHQEGHLMAGLWSAGIRGGSYLAAHLSGGTTDFIEVDEKRPGHLLITELSSSSDLHAGQFIDRIGRALGLGFPAGPELEKLAAGGQTGHLTLTAAHAEGTISFSGPLSQAERMLKGGAAKADLARAVEACIADSVCAAAEYHFGKKRYRGFLVVGGVAANDFIKKRICGRLGGLAVEFAHPAYAGDNAVGLAVSAARRFAEEGINVAGGEEV